MKPKILMITTGGTIASLKTEDGLAPGLSGEEILDYVPAVREMCEVDARQVCHLDSTNVTPEHWRLMVRAIEENYADYDGFVICHGTDTLAYTAAASRRPSGLRKTISSHNSLAHRTTWLRSDLRIMPITTAL